MVRRGAVEGYDAAALLATFTEGCVRSKAVASKHKGLCLISGSRQQSVIYGAVKQVSLRLVRLRRFRLGLGSACRAQYGGFQNCFGSKEKWSCDVKQKSHSRGVPVQQPFPQQHRKPQQFGEAEAFRQFSVYLKTGGRSPGLPLRCAAWAD